MARAAWHDVDNSKCTSATRASTKSSRIQLNNLGMPVGCTSAKLSTCDHRCCGGRALLPPGQALRRVRAKDIVVFSSPDLGGNFLGAQLHLGSARGGGPFGGQPQDLAALDGELFVADTQNHRIVVLACPTGVGAHPRQAGTAPASSASPPPSPRAPRRRRLPHRRRIQRAASRSSRCGAPSTPHARAGGARARRPLLRADDRVYATAPGAPLLVFDLKMTNRTAATLHHSPRPKAPRLAHLEHPGGTFIFAIESTSAACTNSTRSRALRRGARRGAPRARRRARAG